MSYHNQSYNPLQLITIRALTDILPNRFVTSGGLYCSAGEKAIGATEQKWANNEMMSAITYGTAIIEAESEISSGENVTSAADGKAKTAGETDEINGRALTNSTSSGYVKILLVP